ncbi:MAG TPA: histone deacetylase family protein [Gammaproteobacteria bacterium]|nr:histone deacetylase family protein [Gammaproteobacteria bacterium]
MHTAFISHPDCLRHETGNGHPESAARLHAIEDRLIEVQLYYLLRHFDANEVTREQLLRVHDPAYLDALDAKPVTGGLHYLDPDTAIGPHSLRAARRAAGAVVMAVDHIMQGEIDSAFCAVRPPGHHARRHQAMGFCIYNNIAVGVAHALSTHPLERVAVLDFDVHHGNGTEEIFADDPRVMICSTFQHPFYPGYPFEENGSRIICAPLPAGAGGAEFRAAVEQKFLPALERFKPQMLFISAGFDAHRDDDMSAINLTEADYTWVTRAIMAVAGRHAANRIVSSLEGGYELHSLARSVEAHLRALMDLH